MIKFWERDSSTNETIADFEARVNREVDELRDANLVVNLAALPGPTLTVWGQVGADEPVVNNGQLLGMRFKDQPGAEVKKKLDARKAALARGPSRVLGPKD